MYNQRKKDSQGGIIPGFLLVGQGENLGEADLPRNRQGRAFIGDPRNDENIIISQLQLVFIKLHNRIMEQVIKGKEKVSFHDFAEAQRRVRWHYQWVVVHDFLKRIVGAKMLNRVLPKRNQDPRQPKLRFFNWREQPFMPVEFSVAAYRLGHSMVRSSYVLSDRLEQTLLAAITDDVTDDIRELRGALSIFLPSDEDPRQDHNLRGFRRLPEFWTIQWDRFLKIKKTDGSFSSPQMSRLINTKLSYPLSQMPDDSGGTNALAALNLKRGWRMGLPSGQDVSRAMGIDPIHNPTGHDPLWFYILKEAELPETIGGGDGGKHLGAVGGAIVAEVFLGLLAGDPLSYLNINPRWQPTLPKQGDKFELRDIVEIATNSSVDLGDG
jgi:hypothetical protein